MALSGKQKKYLRGLAHSLKPVVQLGKEGLTNGIERQLIKALEDHELVKIRFGAGFEADHDEALDHLLKDSESELAGRIGHTAVLYRRRAEEPEIRLP